MQLLKADIFIASLSMLKKKFACITHLHILIACFFREYSRQYICTFDKVTICSCAFRILRVNAFIPGQFLLQVRTDDKKQELKQDDQNSHMAVNYIYRHV